MTVWDDWDRPDALLTSAQRRAFLDDEHRENLSESYKSVLPSRVRTRLQHGILDFHILLHHLSDEELRKAFATRFDDVLDDDDYPGTSPDTALHFTVADLVGILYRLGLTLEDGNLSPQFEQAYKVHRSDRAHPQADAMLTDLTQRGIVEALEAHGERGDPEVSIDTLDVRPIEQLADMPLNELPDTALTTLLSVGEITPEEYSEVIQSRMDEGDDAPDRSLPPDPRGHEREHPEDWREENIFEAPDGFDDDDAAGNASDEDSRDNQQDDDCGE